MAKTEVAHSLVDVYYADCVQSQGNCPKWSAVRSGAQLAPENTRTLRKHLQDLWKRKKQQCTFGDHPIDVDHPLNQSVQSLLQAILSLPTVEDGLAGLRDYGEVLARKYLSVRWARTRLFTVSRLVVQGQLHVALMVSDLEDFDVSHIQPGSLDFVQQHISNRLGDMQKGALFPALGDDHVDYGTVLVWESSPSSYYVASLECVPKHSPEAEAQGVLAIVGRVASVSNAQLSELLESIRTSAVGTIGCDDLATELERIGATEDEKAVRDEWAKAFGHSNYLVSASALSLDTVKVTLQLDEFQITCPLSYYPDRVKHNHEGGYHSLLLTGVTYSRLRSRGAEIDFSE